MTKEQTQTDTPTRRKLTGTVKSVGGAKTITVVVQNLVKSPRYGKFVRNRTKLAVHDPQGQAGVGDIVEIAECRRISKTKSWRLLGVVRKSTLPEATSAKEE